MGLLDLDRSASVRLARMLLPNAGWVRYIACC
jgi:hypothetical protein